MLTNLRRMIFLRIHLFINQYMYRFESLNQISCCFDYLFLMHKYSVIKVIIGLINHL